MTHWPHIDSAMIAELQICNIVLVLRVAHRKLVAGWNYYLLTFLVFVLFLLLFFFLLSSLFL